MSTKRMRLCRRKLARTWTEAEEAYLFDARQRRVPHKHIAEKLGKTELACRLHYHQIAVVRKRFERAPERSPNLDGTTSSPASSEDSGPETLSPPSAPSTPAQAVPASRPSGRVLSDCTANHYRSWSLPETAIPIWSTFNKDGTVLVLYSPSPSYSATSADASTPHTSFASSRQLAVITGSPTPSMAETDGGRDARPLPADRTPGHQARLFDSMLPAIDMYDLAGFGPPDTFSCPTGAPKLRCSQSPPTSQFRCSVNALLN